MNEPLEAVYHYLSGRNRFPANSRYYGSPCASLKGSDGQVVTYLCRRIIPQPESLALQHQHTVASSERLDAITAHYLGDPEQFWRICDANRTMWPGELTETVGAALRITLPEGIPGVSGA